MYGSPGEGLNTIYVFFLMLIVRPKLEHRTIHKAKQHWNIKIKLFMITPPTVEIYETTDATSKPTNMKKNTKKKSFKPTRETLYIDRKI